MAPYLGLSGKSLNFIIGIIGATAFALQGYDQAVGNGILTLKTFLNVFPQTDTLDTKGAQKSHNRTRPWRMYRDCSYVDFGMCER